MNFKFNKPVQAIMQKCGINQRTIIFAAGEARGLMHQFVPADTGYLASNTDVIIESDTKGSIVYTAPYAQFCYYGEKLRFSREKHLKAGAFWDRSMMQLYKGELYSRIDNFIKKK